MSQQLSPTNTDDVSRSGEEGAAATDLPLDSIYGILSNERRRRTLRYLRSNSNVSLGELAQHIASIENEKPIEELSSAERKRVYICLYQCHLPKMDEADVIDFDSDRKSIRPSEHTSDIMRYLPENIEPGPADDTDEGTFEVGALTQGVMGRLRRTRKALSQR